MFGAAPDEGESTGLREHGAAARGSLLELVLARIRDAFSALDRADRFTYINEQAGKLLRRPVTEMLGKNIWELFPAALNQPFYQAYQQALATQAPTCVEDYYAPWDLWVESRIYPSEDGISIFSHDISDRKRSEALLAGQSRILEMITHGATQRAVLDALLRFIESQCRGTRGSILLLDSSGTRLCHGASPSLPESFTLAIDGAEIGPSAGSCGTAAFLGQPVMTEDIELDPRWERWRDLARPLGLRACWSTPIFEDKGRVLGTFAMYYAEPTKLRAEDQAVVAMATHIAAVAIAHERAQCARRQSESRYRCLVDSNMVGVLILDRAGAIKEANDALLKIIGQTRAELGAGALRWSMKKPGTTTDAEPLTRLYTSGGCAALDCMCKHKLGHYVWIRVTAALIEGSDDAICLVEDITERREQERVREKNVELEESKRAALEASRLKSEFLASMSHELRTPLNAIIGFSELLADGIAGELSQKQAEYVGHVLVGGKHLLQLINDVLDLAKIESGKFELCPVEFQLQTELQDICSVARALGKKKRIAVSLRCDPSLDRVTLDPQKLRQVLFNLLGNAVRFTGEGGLIELEAYPIEPDKVELRVRDTGIGISADDLPKLFHEFSQLSHGGSARDDEGTGLGLVLAKRLVESLGGQIGVESSLGSGSTFSIVLPRVLPLTQ